MKIGIMGGTFNPIHNGHLLIGEYARTSLGLDKVIYMPTGKSYHKSDKFVVDGQDRYDMVSLAVEDNPYFYSSDLEVRRSGNTYTIDSLKIIKDKYNNWDIYFIIGEDSLMSLSFWKDIEELGKLCSFLVFRRGNIPYRELELKIESLESQYSLKIDFLDSPVFNVSSTDIRDRLRHGKSVKYLLPEKVIEYIEEKNLYGDVNFDS